MVDQQLLQLIEKEKDYLVPTIFKPVQFGVLQKLNKHKKLSQNEQRYLRGKIKDKLTALSSLLEGFSAQDNLQSFLSMVGSYYITGFEALKHNGYGWYYEPKIIEVINTKLEGIIALKNKTIKFIRVKSIRNCKITRDKITGLNYASNEQIIKDVSFTKNSYVKTVWESMLFKYWKIFVKNPERFNKVIDSQEINYSEWGI